MLEHGEGALAALHFAILEALDANEDEQRRELLRGRGEAEG